MKHSDVAGNHGSTTMNNVRRINVLVAGTDASSLIRYLTLHNVQNKTLGSIIINRARYCLQEAKKGIIQKNEDGVYDLCIRSVICIRHCRTCYDEAFKSCLNFNSTQNILFIYRASHSYYRLNFLLRHPFNFMVLYWFSNKFEHKISDLLAQSLAGVTYAQHRLSLRMQHACHWPLFLWHYGHVGYLVIF